jgi:hypothetical protein
VTAKSYFQTGTEKVTPTKEETYVQDTEKETSRELNKVENNKVLQLKDNDLAIQKTENNQQINNYIVQDTTQVHADIILHNSKTSLDEKIISVYDYEELNPADMIKYDKRTTYIFLKDKLITEHSLLSLIFKRSLKEPAFIRILKLNFSLSIQFALNGMLMTDDNITAIGNDSNIIDKLWSQFGISLLSVFISSFLSFIVFFLLYVPKKHKELINQGLLTNNLEFIKEA